MAETKPFVLLDDARAEGASDAHLFENPREIFVARRPDEVQATLPESAADRELIAEWDRIYRIYIADRRATEAKLAAGEHTELNESTLNGSPVSESIDDFTKVNRMDSCSVPTGR